MKGKGRTLMKKLIKSLKSALAALAVVGLSCSAGAADGDIYSIDLVNSYNGLIPTSSSPLTIGEKAVVRVRLANRDWSAAGKPWRLMPTAAYAALGEVMQTQYPMQLGLMLGGQQVFATHVATLEVANPASTYTDFYFEYTVKPGDLAMPAQLMNESGQAASAATSADYMLNNSAYWQIVNDDGDEAVFHFTTLGGAMPLVAGQPQNYCPSGIGMGLYVQTVDFDKNYVEEAAAAGEVSVWRRIYRTLSTTSSTQPSVVVNGTPTTAITMYVWVEDESIAAPILTDGATLVDGRYVLPVSFAAGSDPTKTFRLKGLATGTTTVRMSSTPNLVYDDLGALVENWVERTVQVVEPPAPYASVEVLDRSMAGSLSQVTCPTNYQDYVAVMRVALNVQAPTSAVKVDIVPDVDVWPAALGSRRIGVSASSDPTDRPWLDCTTSVTFNAGETERYLYLYALDQTDDLASLAGKGKVTFTPTLSGAGAADYTGDAKSGTFSISPMKPVIVSPAAGDTLSDAIAGEPYALDLMVADTYRRLRQNGWTVQLRSSALGSSGWKTYSDDVEVDSETGYVTLNVTFMIEKDDADLEIRVVNPKDENNGTRTSASVKTKISVTAPKKASATFDRGAAQYAESRTETAKAYFQISQPSETAKALYAYLRPINDDASNKVSSAAFTTAMPNQGVYIAPGSLDSANLYAELSLLDGNCSALYEVVICTSSSYSKEREASYVAGQCALVVTNVMPTIRSVSMGGSSVKVSGGVMPKKVAQGIKKAFAIDVQDPGRLDLEASGDDAFCVKWNFGGGDEVYVWGNPSTNSISRVFTTPGEVEVTVQCQDKDMRASNIWTEPFTFTVDVLDAPAVTIVQRDGRSLFYEDETGDANSRFYVMLNVAPDFTNATDRLKVDLAVELGDDSDSGYSAADCVLSRTSVEFSSGMTNGPTFYLKSLDGTSQSQSKGFRITATVSADSAALDAEGKTWMSGDCELTVLNRAPSILMPAERKDAEGNPISTTTTINETQSVGWSVTDVDADLSGLAVTWVTSEGQRMEYVQGTGADTDTRKYVADVRSGTHAFYFTGSGEKTVIMTVTDKDGGQSSTTLYYSIAASKTMEILPQGPSSGNGTTLSAKYRDKASGIGEGRVWTANAASQIANWVFSYGCGLDNEFRVYGKGYRVGEVDPLVDVDGNGVGTSGGAGYTYPDQQFDSYLYAWLQLVRAEGNATLSDQVISVAPEQPGSANSGTVVAMPTEKDDDGNYSKTILEAVFSRECYATDNMGDINLDGIPDAYVKKYSMGVFDDDGKLTGNDLAKVATFNDDEDVLPAEDAYSEERPFTALLEIRGYGTGLNDAPTLAGLKGFSPDRRYTDPAADADSTLTAVEYLAWLDYAAANGLGAANPDDWPKWSPERPTDPTTDDTDEDGFSDGFEYYYWYRAHVGYLETRTIYGITVTNHVYLTGRAFDPANPDGQPIPAETIAALMDPLTAYGDKDSAATRDTDNDGLPDLLEFELGTNPFDFDTDRDGLPDGYEVLVSGTDPLKYATDGLTCDARRNFDGDHMAYTTVYRLATDGDVADTRSACGEEQFCSANGVTTSNIVYRSVFAVAMTNEGPAVVQWFAVADTNNVKLSTAEVAEDITVLEVYDGVGAWEEAKSWSSVAVRAASVPLADAGTVGSFAVQRLAADVAAADAFEVAETNAAGVARRGLPRRLARGTFVRGSAAAAGYEQLIVEEDVPCATNACNIAWQYGSADGGYGELAIGRTQEVKKASIVLSAPDPTRTLAFVHSYVFQEHGFDPRTAWSSTSPFSSRNGGISAMPMRTRPYTTYDEFLLMLYYLNSGAVDVSDLTPTKENPWSTIFARYLTNPRGPGETLSSTNSVSTTLDENGADTDGDGVPDGWELYVMSGHKDEGGNFKIAGPESVYSPTRAYWEFPAEEQDPDGDTLSEWSEFAAFDTCNAYSNVSTTVVRPESDANWVNKLLPTNPYDSDTDGDGVSDSDERDAFAYGVPEREGGVSIPGGGLNPCSIDTDGDGLPDGWELQFAGTYDEDASTTVTSTSTNGSDVVTTTNTTVVGAFGGGMDGTVSDATLDYDMDGLENWQEYMVGAMRCWRYDDPITPFFAIPSSWYYSFAGFSPQLDKFGFEDMDEFLYRTFEDKFSPYYNPHLISDQASCSRYFSHVTNTWDVVYRSDGSAQYMLKDRLDDITYKDLFELYILEQRKKDKSESEDSERSNIGETSKYISCDPTKADTDQDGMDDYYELFHGLNPLLGAAGRIAAHGACDIVYEAWGGTGNTATDVAQFANNCTWVRARDMTLDPTKLDFVSYPWFNGLASADPDGDDIRNQDEAIVPRIGSMQGYHTDPSPLWMTDVNYEHSLTRQFYTMPTREKSSLGSITSYTWEGKERFLLSRPGMMTVDLGGGPEPALTDYTLDRWGLNGTGNYQYKAYMFSFEQTEGYDTDGDCYGDRDEISGKFERATTDPLSAHSPTRRQAMYFPGPSTWSMLLSPTYTAVARPDGQFFANEMAFTQFTVEFWAYPESLADSTLVERTVNTAWSHPADETYVRRNFNVSIKDGKWYAYYNPNGTVAADLVEVFSKESAAANAWTHVAVTYDGTALRVYVNGQESGRKDSGLRPCNGSVSIRMTDSEESAENQNLYVSDAAKGNFVFCIGASASADAFSGMGKSKYAYSKCYTGYIDEVRVWDGARSADAVKSEMKTRYTPALAQENRLKVYEEWSTGIVRYNKDSNGNDYDPTPELRYHYSFDTLPAGENPNSIAKFAHGLGSTGDKPPVGRPTGYTHFFWDYIVNGYGSLVSGYGSVYDSLLWVPWVQNTVAMLPRMDGMTTDSQYWTEDFMGTVRGSYKFPRTAEPFINWVQACRVGIDTSSSIESRPDHLATVEGNFGTLFNFETRNRNLYADALLPLGGAYVKYVPASVGFWDGQGASSTSPISGRDSDNDGLPDWWELYAEENYRRADMDQSEFISWNTVVDYNGRLITAGEAYLYDLAHGAYQDADGNTHISSKEYAQTSDVNGVGIPDWWMELYGITGEGAFDDHDNDGLCNIIEFILSERFDIRDADGNRKNFDPTVAKSVMTHDVDYFFPVGSLYVGGIFADHDFIEDVWERQYTADYVSPLVYDGKTDNDDDGWSAFAEARYSQQVSPIEANNKNHFDITSGLVRDYPIPAVQLTVKYNGARAAAMESTSYGVWIGRDLSGAKTPDAMYWIKGSAVADASESGTAVNETNEYKRVIGKWSNRRVMGTLTPGKIKADSIEIQTVYEPSETVYSWRIRNAPDGDSYYHYERGTKAEYQQALRKWGYDRVILLSTTDGYKRLENMSVRTDLNTEVATLSFDSTDFGTVNLKTGEYDLNLGMFAGAYVKDVDDTNDTSVVSLEDQTYRIVYQVNPSTGVPRELYLGEADTGYVREGKNQVFVWADLNGDGAFTVGEPCGYTREVDIGWRTRALTVEVRDHSPIMPRITIAGSDTASSSSSSVTSSTGSMDRGKTMSGYYAELKDRINDMDATDVAREYMLAQLEWYYTNRYEAASLDTSSTELTRVRVVRWLVDGEPVYRIGAEPQVVLDQKMLLSNRAFLAEGDILADSSSFDLDWAWLKDRVVDYRGVQLAGCDVTNVAYLVVVGDGRVSWNSSADTNSCPKVLDRVIERRYSFERAATSPVNENAVVYAGRPTLKWAIVGEDDSDYTGYTAFQLQILPPDGSGETPVWTSGTQLLPPRDSYGNYVYEVPAYVGDELEGGLNYRWRVSVLNAKFPTPDWESALTPTGCFRMEPKTITGDYGTIRACVRYFGPKAQVLDQGTVRVEAFESPDFTGLPAARASLSSADEKTAIATPDSEHVCQVELQGLKAGVKYYVRAYIDSDTYGTAKTRDDWESWGYSCDRTGASADMFAPLAWQVDASTLGGLCTVYIEDTDINGNRIPDAYEMYVNDGTLDNGAQNLDETLHCGLAVKSSLVSGLDQTTTDESDYSGLIAHSVGVLQTRAMVALALGVPATSVSVDSSGQVQILNQAESVEVTNISLADGKISLEVQTKSSSSEVTAEAQSIYGDVAVSPVTVTVEVLRSETPNGDDWPTVKTETLTISGTQTTTLVLDLSSDDTASSAFYKVRIRE